MTVEAGGGLVDAVAARAGVNRDVVDRVLMEHAIPIAAVPTAARSLRVARLRLRGTKVDAPGAGAFDRTFTFPTDVVMAVADNLRGKTSLLELITLCLRGTPRDLQLDVAAWLDQVECDVEVNGVPLGFHLDMSDGKITAAIVYEAESLDALADPRAPRGRVLVDAGGPAEYASAVEALMLNRLGLDPIYAAVRDGGQQVHAWPSYFGAIYLPAGGERVLLGETVMGGLAGRLLQVFLDLPGAALLTRVRTLRKTMQSKAAADAEQAKSVDARNVALTSQQRTELAQARAALAALPAMPAVSATEAASRVTALAVRLADADADWHAASTAHLQAMAGRQIDEQALNNARETAVATRLFHGLDPASCPRCETPVDSDRRAQEAAEHRCAVCAAPLTEDDNDAAADLIAEREQTLAASRAAEDDARRALEATEDEMSRLTRDLEAADTDLREAHAAREVGERATLETAIARAEGALAVLEIRDDQPPESDQTLVVLDALDGELDERLQTTARGLLDTLGQDIAELARRFGIQSVTAVTLNRAAAMRIEKGGVAAGSFSSQSPGERLRLRIATVIALLRVGARLGIATHPGLLMIDSLRAEEVQDVDAHALLDALVDIARDTPGLQVLTTSADATLPTGRLPDEAVLRPVQGDDALW